MFGHHFKSLDDKKRLVIPAKLRKDLGVIAYVTFTSDRILEVRSETDFNELKTRLLANNSLNKTVRQYLRIIFANTAEVELDKIGRINIPETLLMKAAIKKEVVILGVGNKIEIWPKDKYDEFDAKMSEENALDALAKKMYDEGAKI